MHRVRMCLPGLAIALMASLALAAPASAGHDRGCDGKKKGLKGSTTLAVDPATAEALAGLGLTIRALRPANTYDGAFAFPITGGRLDLDRGRGKIRHAGGLELRTSSTAVRVKNFVIRLDRDPDLTAKVVGGPRISLLDLDLSEADIDVRRGRITVSGVAATLSEEGAAALNDAFGTNLAPGTPIGEATVKAKRGRGHDRDDDDDREDDRGDSRDDDDRDDEDDDD